MGFDVTEGRSSTAAYVLDVACPLCQRGPGEACVTLNTSWPTRTHAARHTAAQRPDAHGKRASRTQYEVYLWWCGIQGAEAYSEGSRYLNPDDDGYYADAYAIWTEFYATDDASDPS